MEIFLAQPACHAQNVRLDQSKVLSERKNFEWADLKPEGDTLEG